MSFASFIAFGVPVVDLPRCQACGGEYVDFFIDREMQDGQLRLVATASCGNAVEDVDDEFDEFCESLPLVVDVGDCASWREAFLRCINAWSQVNGGYVFQADGVLPDDLEDFVELAEDRGSLPEFLRLE